MTEIDITAIPFPTDATLKKYGMSRLEWAELYNSQHGECGICHKVFQPGHRVNIDHVHVKGWKQMAPEDRKRYVRGLLCYTCNKFMVMRGITADKLYDGWQYMSRFETRITVEKLMKQEKELRYLHSGKKVVKRRNISHTDQE